MHTAATSEVNAVTENDRCNGIEQSVETKNPVAVVVGFPCATRPELCRELLGLPSLQNLYRAMTKHPL